MKQYYVFKQNVWQILSLAQRDGQTWRLMCKVRQVRHGRTNGRQTPPHLTSVGNLRKLNSQKQRTEW